MINRSSYLARLSQSWQAPSFEDRAARRITIGTNRPKARKEKLVWPAHIVRPWFVLGISFASVCGSVACSSDTDDDRRVIRNSGGAAGTTSSGGTNSGSGGSAAAGKGG